MTLLLMVSRDMGRYLDGSDMESFLWNGITLAVFHCSRNIPRERRSCKKRLRGLASSAAHSLRTIVGISSGLMLFLDPVLRKIFLTCFGLKWTLPIEGDGKGQGC